MVQGCSVLLVEDSIDLKDLFIIYLTQAGFTPTYVGCISDARAALEADEFDFIISDIGLPDEDGLSFLRSLRNSNFKSRSAPALAITAFEDIEEVAAKAGFDSLLLKPFGRSELIFALSEISNRRNRVELNDQILAMN